MERDLKKALNLGKLSQIGIVVRDLQRTIKNYEEIIGIGRSTFIVLQDRNLQRV